MAIGPDAGHRFLADVAAFFVIDRPLFQIGVDRDNLLRQFEAPARNTLLDSHNVCRSRIDKSKCRGQLLPESIMKRRIAPDVPALLGESAHGNDPAMLGRWRFF